MILGGAALLWLLWGTWRSLRRRERSDARGRVIA
jgi:threonine/homoserine/homoserine lactone efflux protein